MRLTDAELRQWAEQQSSAELAYFITDEFAGRLKAMPHTANYRDYVERRRPIYVAAQTRKRLGVGK